MSPAPLVDFAALVRARLEAPRAVQYATLGRGLSKMVLRQLEDDRDDGPRRITASQLGSCARRLAYAAAGAPRDGREEDARSRLVFAFGDITEALLVALLREAIGKDGVAGWRLAATSAQRAGQRRLTLRLPGIDYPIYGHPDGVLMHESGVRALLSIKSASSYGFARWAESFSGLPLRDDLPAWSDDRVPLVQYTPEARRPWGPDEGYWWQENAYLHADSLELVYVLAMAKDSGALAGWWQWRDDEFAAMAADHVGRVVADVASPDDARRVLPDGTVLGPSPATYYQRAGTRPDGTRYHAGGAKPDGGKLPWQCAYCPWYRRCWGAALHETVEHDGRTGTPKRVLYVRGA